MIRYILSAILFTFAMLHCNSSKATIIYVDSSNTQLQDGTSWTTAYSNMQTALNSATAGDSIWVAKGTYQLAYNTSFALKNGVKIFGGFLNTHTIFSQRSPLLNPAILSGNGKSVIVVNSAIDSGTVLDGLVIANGSNDWGGGLRSHGNTISFIIRNCIFRNNTATGGMTRFGGAVYIYTNSSARQNPVFENCIFENNVSNEQGGAIYFISNSTNHKLSIQHCTFTGNSTNSNGAAAWGGALFANGGVVEINNTSFDHNSATYTTTNSGASGGAIYVNNTTLSIDHSSFTGNKAVHTGVGGLYGGAIYAFASLLRINASIFYNNTLSAAASNLYENAGGAIYSGLSSTILTKNLYSHNQSAKSGGQVQIIGRRAGSPSSGIDSCFFIGGKSGHGGAMYLKNVPDILISNTLFSFDTAISGGAVYSTLSFPTFANCLFDNNMADSFGGAVYNHSFTSRFVNNTMSKNKAGVLAAAIYNTDAESAVTNTIIWGNANTAIVNTGTGKLTASHSLIQGYSANNATKMIDGSTNPLFVDTAANNFRLSGNSPCIDKGANDSIPTGIITDMDGHTRIYNQIADMGAYEFIVMPPAVSLGNDTTICVGDTLALNAGNLGSTYLWSNNATSPTIDVTAPGTYYVTVTNIEGQTSDTIIVALTALPVVNLGNDLSFCKGNSMVLNAGNNGADFKWNTNQTTQSITADTSGTYIVTVTDIYGCKGTDTIQITVHALPLIELGNDTAICAGSYLSINAQNTGSDFYWNTGAVTQSITTDTGGQYIVTVTNTNNCVNTDTLNLTLNALPVVTLGRDTAICFGSSIQLDAQNNGALFAWNTGAGTQTIVADTAGRYIVTVTDVNKCSNNDTLYLTVNPLPEVNLGADTGFCAGNILIADAQNPGASYLWSTNETSRSIEVSATGNYAVTVTDINNCKASDTIYVEIHTLPVVHLGNDTMLNTGKNLTLDAKNQGADYLWNTGARTQSITVNTGGLYYVTVENIYGCTGSDTIKVTFRDDNTAVTDPDIPEYTLIVYPNPAKDQVVLSVKQSPLLQQNATLYDMQGRILRVITINRDTIPVSLADLGAGQYFIKLDNGLSISFIKE